MNPNQNDQEAFKQFLVKQKQRSLIYILLFMVALLGVVYLTARNYQYKHELEIKKSQLQGQLKDIKEMESANNNYVKFQTILTDSLKKALTMCGRDLKNTEEQLEVRGVTPNVLQPGKQYTASTSKSTAAASGFKGYKVGIYYYEGGEVMAKKILLHLKKSGFRGQTQLYKKDEEFFQKVGAPRDFEIRYEKRLEDTEAFQLKSVMDSWSLKNQFRLRPVVSRTPNFLSIFVPPQTSK